MAEPDDLALAHLLADEADRIARATFVAGRTTDHDIKDDGSPVSAVDVAVEEALLEILRQQRRDDGVLGEEVGAHGDAASRRYWTLDGIDGTAAFVSGSHLWSTLIGLVADGEPQLGVSTSTGQRRRWWAQTGSGAWSGGLDRHGRVAAPSPLKATSLSADEPPRAWIEPRPDTNLAPGIAQLMGRVRHVEMTTHPAKMVAAGDLDLAVMYAAGIWDLAPLIPLVNEAGGHCFDVAGGTLHHLTGDVIFTGENAATALTELLAP